MNLHSAIPVLTVMNFHHGLLEKGTTSEMKRIRETFKRGASEMFQTERVGYAAA
jgi:hypothetical protein